MLRILLFAAQILFAGISHAEDLSFNEGGVAFSLPNGWSIAKRETNAETGNLVIQITYATPTGQPIPGLALTIRPRHQQATPESFFYWIFDITRRENPGYRKESRVQESSTTIAVTSAVFSRENPTITMYERYVVTDSIMVNMRMAISETDLNNTTWSEEMINSLNAFVSSLAINGQKGKPHLIRANNRRLIIH